MTPEQLGAEHHARLAYVYIRQSSLQQVLHHTESQRRQRALVERAVQLGWRPERVQVVDEDLGRSGARTQRRSGFERLLSAVAVGEVGIILALEASRISRDNRNWYHLLDICAITHTLIADAEALYDTWEQPDWRKNKNVPANQRITLLLEGQQAGTSG